MRPPSKDHERCFGCFGWMEEGSFRNYCFMYGHGRSPAQGGDSHPLMVSLAINREARVPLNLFLHPSCLGDSGSRQLMAQQI